MTAAGGYILLVPENRRELLLKETEDGGSFYLGKSWVSEPVPKFDHGHQFPLAVFVSFEDGVITHFADGRKGPTAGTGLVRLDLGNLEPLANPVAFDKILAGTKKRLWQYLKPRVDRGGLLPPKTLIAFIDYLVKSNPSIGSRLERFSARRAETLRRLKPETRENLAYQKETLSLALKIADLPKEEVLAWQPTNDQQRSFLDGLSGVRVREDNMLLSDFSKFPGFQPMDEVTRYSTRVFCSEQDPTKRLTVIMANRFPLEEQTGADLVYFNEAYHSFIMVQYKAMEKREGKPPEFRWQENDQFSREIDRMETLLNELGKLPSSQDPDGYRLTDNPFFLKFCSRVVLEPDATGLFPGMYLPLNFWRYSEAAERFRGERGGKVLTYENVRRYFNNTDFANLVTDSWVGTSPEQFAVLRDLIRKVLKEGKTVAIATQHSAESVDAMVKTAE